MTCRTGLPILLVRGRTECDTSYELVTNIPYLSSISVLALFSKATPRPCNSDHLPQLLMINIVYPLLQG